MSIDKIEQKEHASPADNAEEKTPMPTANDAKAEMHKILLQNRSKSRGYNSFRVKGYLTLFSGFLWMLYVGSHFMVGNISPYIGSYFEEASNGDAQTLFPIIVFSSMFFNFLGSQIVKRQLLHPKLIIAMGAVVGIGGCYLCTFTTNWTIFRIVFPASYGFMVGFTFMVHLYLSWKYIPGYEGFLTGIVNAGFGSGGALFNYLSSALVNPNKVDPIKPTADDPNVKPFPPEVADNVPVMLRTLCYIWLGIFIVSFLTIQGYPSYDELEKEKAELEEKKEKYEKMLAPSGEEQRSSMIEERKSSILSGKGSTKFIIQGNRSEISSSQQDDFQSSQRMSTITKNMMIEHQELLKNKRQFSVDEDRAAFFLKKSNSLAEPKVDGEENALIAKDGPIDIENIDRTKMTNMVLSVIEERLDSVAEIQEWCIVIEEATLFDLLKTRQFIEIFFMSFSSVLIGLFIIGSSKAYGQATISNEEFLTIAATLSSIFNIFRFIWSSLMEKYGFKLIYMILLAIQLVIGVALPLLTKFSTKSTFTEYFFLIAVGIMTLTEGGHFVLIPTIYAKIFGIDGGLRVYSVGFCFVGLASLFNTIIIEIFLDLISYEGLCYVYSCFNLACMLYLGLRFKFKKITCCDMR